MPKHLFNWTSRVTPRIEKVSPDLVKLWAACKNGTEVKVSSAYGRPPSGMRGMFTHECGCGYNFDHVQDRGFRINDRYGCEHLVDAMALHLVACHIEKVDDAEKKLLDSLPPQDELINKEGLEEILGKKLPYVTT